MRNLTLRGIDAWITREDEPSEPWGECEYCGQRYAERHLFICTPEDILACRECCTALTCDNA